MTTHVDIYGGRDPRDLAFYAPADAARILRVNPATVRAWAFGRTYPRADGPQRWPALIEAADPNTRRLSFRNLVELYVLSVLRRKDGRVPLGSHDRVRIAKIRKATRALRESMGTAHPLAQVDLHTDWVDLYVEYLGVLRNVTADQQSLRTVVERHLQRIERDEQGLARSLFPVTRDDDDDSPRLVVIDPRRRFGRPVLASTNLETAVIAERFWGGDSTDEIARDFDIGRDAVEEAVRFENLLHTRDAA